MSDEEGATIAGRVCENAGWGPLGAQPPGEDMKCRRMPHAQHGNGGGKFSTHPHVPCFNRVYVLDNFFLLKRVAQFLVLIIEGVVLRSHAVR